MKEKCEDILRDISPTMEEKMQKILNTVCYQGT